MHFNFPHRIPHPFAPHSQSLERIHVQGTSLIASDTETASTFHIQVLKRTIKRGTEEAKMDEQLKKVSNWPSAAVQTFVEPNTGRQRPSWLSTARQASNSSWPCPTLQNMLACVSKILFAHQDCIGQAQHEVRTFVFV